MMYNFFKKLLKKGKYQKMVFLKPFFGIKYVQVFYKYLGFTYKSKIVKGPRIK